MELKNKVIDYISLRGLDIGRVASDTGISVDCLKKDSGVNIDADELCVLCVYLGIKPENLYIKRNCEKKDIYYGG